MLNGIKPSAAEDLSTAREINSSSPKASLPFLPLELETRPTVTTAAIAHYTHMAQQTWRIYACKETGPLRPLRIAGRLLWPTAELKRLLGVA